MKTNLPFAMTYIFVRIFLLTELSHVVCNTYSFHINIKSFAQETYGDTFSTPVTQVIDNLICKLDLKKKLTEFDVDCSKDSRPKVVCFKTPKVFLIDCSNPAYLSFYLNKFLSSLLRSWANGKNDTVH